MPDDFIYPRMPRKQIELWGIKSTSGNFQPYQIQTANIYFNYKLSNDYLVNEWWGSRFVYQCCRCVCLLVRRLQGLPCALDTRAYTWPDSLPTLISYLHEEQDRLLKHESPIGHINCTSPMFIKGKTKTQVGSLFFQLNFRSAKLKKMWNIEENK